MAVLNNIFYLLGDKNNCALKLICLFPVCKALWGIVEAPIIKAEARNATKLNAEQTNHDLMKTNNNNNNVVTSDVIAAVSPCTDACWENGDTPAKRVKGMDEAAPLIDFGRESGNGLKVDDELDDFRTNSDKPLIDIDEFNNNSAPYPPLCMDTCLLGLAADANNNNNTHLVVEDLITVAKPTRDLIDLCYGRQRLDTDEMMTNEVCDQEDFDELVKANTEDDETEEIEKEGEGENDERNSEDEEENHEENKGKEEEKEEECDIEQSKRNAGNVTDGTVTDKTMSSTMEDNKKPVGTYIDNETDANKESDNLKASVIFNTVEDKVSASTNLSRLHVGKQLPSVSVDTQKVSADEEKVSDSKQKFSDDEQKVSDDKQKISGDKQKTDVSDDTVKPTNIIKSFAYRPYKFAPTPYMAGAIRQWRSVGNLAVQKTLSEPLIVRKPNVESYASQLVQKSESDRNSPVFKPACKLYRSQSIEKPKSETYVQKPTLEPAKIEPVLDSAAVPVLTEKPVDKIASEQEALQKPALEEEVSVRDVPSSSSMVNDVVEKVALGPQNGDALQETTSESEISEAQKSDPSPNCNGCKEDEIELTPELEGSKTADISSNSLADENLTPTPAPNELAVEKMAAKNENGNNIVVRSAILQSKPILVKKSMSFSDMSCRNNSANLLSPMMFYTSHASDKTMAWPKPLENVSVYNSPRFYEKAPLIRSAVSWKRRSDPVGELGKRSDGIPGLMLKSGMGNAEDDLDKEVRDILRSRSKARHSSISSGSVVSDGGKKVGGILLLLLLSYCVVFFSRGTNMMFDVCECNGRCWCT